MLPLGSIQGQVSEAGGVVVFEAENFNSNSLPRSSHEWDFGNSIGGSSGSGYMEALPNNGANLAAGGTSPELQFSVNFTSTGTHYIWIRGYALDGTEDSIHVGIDGGSPIATTLSQYNTWQWSNGLQGGGVASLNVAATGNYMISLWMREDGMRIDRVILTTNATFAARTGNVWHIPNSPEATGGVTMRNPLTVNGGTAVTIYNGGQFQGTGDPGNQLQTGSTIFYKRTTDVAWSSVPMTFSSTIANNKYYAGTLPAFSAGENIQYYLKIPFSDHLPTFLYGGDSASQTTELESLAQANAYTFTVQGQAHQGNNTLNLPADLPAATGYATENALGILTFNAPIAVVAPPGETNRLFVVERGGKIQMVTNLNDTPTKQTFLDLTAFLTATGGGALSTSGEQGLLGMAFHPNFAQNGLFYITYDVTINEGGTNKTFDRVARFGVSQSPPFLADTSTHQALISQLDEADNHNGGDLHFGADGYLYISVGDEGGANDSFDNARYINKDFFSAILRIDVDNKAGSLAPNSHSQNSTTYPSAVHAGTYRIPPDNPFVGATSPLSIMFATHKVAWTGTQPEHSWKSSASKA